MKKFEVLRGIFGESEFIEGSFDTLQEANEQAERIADTIVAYGKNSKIKHTYDVYTVETITDEDGEWVSSNCPAGGFYKQVVGII